MKVLLCHNFYQLPGGEDEVFADEGALLESRGHEVVRYTVDNDSVAGMGAADLARRTMWNPSTYADVYRLARRHRVDVVHFHNTFPLMSPSVYYAARAAGAAVVQTLHNYRLLCPNGVLFRDGKPCESCVGSAVAWRGVAHGCYRDDRRATAVAVAMTTAHRAARTWHQAVDAFVTLSQFSRNLFLRGGLPAGRMTVKPNFVSPDPGAGTGRGGYALFVGRLDENKGVRTLLRAWALLRPYVPMRIVGDGPLGEEVRSAAAQDSRLQWLGRRPHAEVYAMMGEARLAVIPSINYEGFPKVLAEAYAAGTPAVVSGLGALAELVSDGRTGVHFRPGDPADLAAKIERLWRDEACLAAMRREARGEFEQKYTADPNYEKLMQVYAGALARRHRRAPEASVLEAGPRLRPRSRLSLPVMPESFEVAAQ
jgi:glycosyltransferase involved in cell wall biosynthesis